MHHAILPDGAAKYLLRVHLVNRGERKEKHVEYEGFDPLTQVKAWFLNGFSWDDGRTMHHVPPHTIERIDVEARA